jgi:conjugative transfer pilus assembly protein TraH
MSKLKISLRAGVYMSVIAAVTAQTWTAPLHANVESEMNSYYNDTGAASVNITGPTAYNSQAGGYYSGGSLYARFPQKNLQPINIQLPSAKGGCGGIDIFSGSFSFANSDQYVALAKSVINSAKGYVFKLAISALSGLIGAKLDDVQGIINAINSANINSCQAAQGLVNSAIDAADLGSTLRCQELTAQQGIGSDWSAAMQRCTSQSSRKQASDQAQASSDPDVQARAAFDTSVPRNLTWKMLKSNSEFNTRSNEFNEMMMNLIGTIVVKSGSGDAGGTIDYYGGDLDKIMQALIYGSASGDTQIFKCQGGYGEDECLDVRVGSVTITPQNSIKGLVLADLRSIRSRILNNQALTNGEKQLIQNTAVPVYKILLVAAAKGNAYLGDTDLENLADVVAIELVDRILSNAIQKLSNSHIASTNASTAEIDQWRAQFTHAGLKLAGTREQIAMRLNILESLIARSQVLESTLKNSLSSQMQASLGFARILRKPGVQ